MNPFIRKMTEEEAKEQNEYLRAKYSKATDDELKRERNLFVHLMKVHGVTTPSQVDLINCELRQRKINEILS